jgi:hypothetical protein
MGAFNFAELGRAQITGRAGGASWVERSAAHKHTYVTSFLRQKNSSRPTVPCDGPRMNRQVDVGNPPRPFRHLRMAERCTPDPSSSRAPVHSALVQKSVTVITNPAGRLSFVMLGELAVNKQEGGAK